MSPTLVRRSLAALLLVVALTWAITGFVARPWTVVGPSMQPTLNPGDRVLVDLWSYRRRSPRPGEVVLLSGPASHPGWLVKRVAATPAGGRGDPFLWPRRREPLHHWLWVVGDNPPESTDSRDFGTIPPGAVRGRVVFRYWPVGRAGRVPSRPEAADPSSR